MTIITFWKDKYVYHRVKKAFICALIQLCIRNIIKYKIHINIDKNQCIHEYLNTYVCIYLFIDTYMYLHIYN